ncbi:RICIN domain-containing protein [Streptomyces sp. NPDC007984]|uniref:RICIN domain-containing protein n=1 Tax=Streptomyces sp. NPDC007984 TaxID=3364801 RepID=UPI0036E17007
MDETELSDGISVHRAAARLPDVPMLQERARALAVISAISAEAPPGASDCGYTYRPSRCPSADGWLLHVPNEGERTVSVHFHGDVGTVVFLWDTDADFHPGRLSPELPEVWEEIIAQVPESLRHCLWHGDNEPEDHSYCDEMPLVTAVMWRLPGDVEWRTAEFSPADEEGHLVTDCADEVLADLIAPGPGTIMLAEGLGVEQASSARTAAIQHILAGQPLTEEVVRSLNPERSLADVADAVAAIGWHSTGPDTAPPASRTAGEGAALVVADFPEPWTLGHFLLEPDGEGYHRILVHHSSMALEAGGTAAGAAVVQSGWHEGDSQKWLLQKFQNGEFRDCAQVSGFAPDETDPGSEDGAEYRIIAKQSGLALQAGTSPGEQPVVLARPHDGDEQIFRRSSLYGYGYWAFLTVRGTERYAMIKY